MSASWRSLLDFAKMMETFERHGVSCAVVEPPADNVLAVHEALDELEKQDPLKAQIVLLCYFSGMTTAETAEVLGLAERTLDRQWRYIRAWLLKRLG
jgi:DNA-directed RNA polymerase specialized sigma24 family protein